MMVPLRGTPRAQHVAGVMSGTSLDGVDVVVARIARRGTDLAIEPLAFTSTPYSPALRTELLHAATREAFPVTALSQLNVRLAHEYARCVTATTETTGVDALNLVGSHGQTVRHVPKAAVCAGLPVTSTLQIGDPSVLANLLRVPVVGDFRMADLALGGQGAPLVPYFDYVVFGHKTVTRGLLNIGGIANLTVLPAGKGLSSVYGFDTGCGNMVMDALARAHYGLPYDEDGAIARQGQVCTATVHEIMQDAYYHRPPPKSTGREDYGPAFVRRLTALCRGRPSEDLLATATKLTASSVFHAYRTYVEDRHPLDVLIVSGGGCRNTTLMASLKACFAPVPVTTSDELGIASESKEALCFAVLAYETMMGNPTSMPGVTGASRSTILGKICLPA